MGYENIASVDMIETTGGRKEVRFAWARSCLKEIFLPSAAHLEAVRSAVQKQLSPVSAWFS